MMSKFIGEIGKVVKLELVLDFAKWVGKTKPTIINEFTDNVGNKVSIVSTKQVIQAIRIGEKVEIEGVIKAHRVIDGVLWTQLEKPYVTKANLNGRGGDVILSK
jgi:hypothetical protein